MSSPKTASVFEAYTSHAFLNEIRSMKSKLTKKINLTGRILDFSPISTELFHTAIYKQRNKVSKYPRRYFSGPNRKFRPLIFILCLITYTGKRK